MNIISQPADSDPAPKRLANEIIEGAYAQFETELKQEYMYTVFNDPKDWTFVEKINDELNGTTRNVILGDTKVVGHGKVTHNGGTTHSQRTVTIEDQGVPVFTFDAMWTEIFN